MNLFQRRKILKKVNFLDLHPVRKLEHQIREDGDVTLLMPRFRKKIEFALFQPRFRDRFIQIKLDHPGSHTWLMIDGTSSVSEICNRLIDQLSGEPGALKEMEERVTKFLSLLYQERYISFMEIEDQPGG
ncbi:MAG: PqqD family protein [Bacteroidales bacterium]|jgi:hypothetical protein|nr:PqqD family protein [Bacteroidales bacterium]